MKGYLCSSGGPQTYVQGSTNLTRCNVFRVAGVKWVEGPIGGNLNNVGEGNRRLDTILTHLDTATSS